ncbi:MAG: acyl-CoA dehydrogenase family protein [Pseudomonadota bacterium]
MPTQQDKLEEFRTHVRTWLAENCPPSMRTPGDITELVRGGSQQVFPNPESKVWLERMVAQGWTVPQWPEQYGGAGLNAAEAAVLQEELTSINARSALQSLDTIMIGPLLLECGTTYQKEKFLRPIARGDILWCQGYSEPGAGSDLASLRTSAERVGDQYVINGAKIWTSYAHYADWMFCLVRTDKDAPKHQGISFLLIDMASPGISASPIHLISGHSPFCEVHFDNVEVPASHLVGELNDGWRLAKRLLELERTMIAGIGEAELGGDGLRLDKLLKAYPAASAHDNPRSSVATQQINDDAFRLLARRAEESDEQALLASAMKYCGTELNKQRLEIALSIVGTQALAWTGESSTEAELALTRDWLRSKANSIEGGSSEIQLNVIAKRILGLPD